MDGRTLRLGVVSDTHLGSGDGRLLALVETCFKDCDGLIHAGDVIGEMPLEGVAMPVYAVAGNCDGGARLPLRRRIEIGGIGIGITHGAGGRERVPLRLLKEFDDVRCVVFGHTHEPCNEKVGGVLLFNPGSPFWPRGRASRSVGLLTVRDGIIEGTHITLEG